MSKAFINDKVMVTPEGGLAIRLTNKSGSASVKGNLAVAHASVDNAFDVSLGADSDMIGVVYEAGVADGSECWVVISGVAEVLLENSTASNAGNWVQSSGVAGRADATASTPPGLVAGHFREIGHCLETKTGGTDVLAKCVLHFN